MENLEVCFVASIVHTIDKITFCLEDEAMNVSFYLENQSTNLDSDLQTLVEKVKVWVRNHDKRINVAFKITNYSQLEIVYTKKLAEIRKPFSEDAMFTIWKLLNMP